MRYLKSITNFTKTIPVRRFKILEKRKKELFPTSQNWPLAFYN